MTIITNFGRVPNEDSVNSDENDASETKAIKINDPLTTHPSDSSETYDEDEPGIYKNEGWVDSIAKILKTNKPKGKKALVLSKAKKLSDVRINKPKTTGFEIQYEDGQAKPEEIKETVEQANSSEPVRKRRRELPNLRVKPNILEKDRERTLSKIATKGVVQLFNAVKVQQKDISGKLKEAGPMEGKKDKVLKSIDKRAFLDVLMGEKSEKVNERVENGRAQRKEVENEKSTWNVLRDDFMMGARLKDWDKEVEEENEVEVEEIIETE